MSLQSRKDKLNLEAGKKLFLKGICDDRYVAFYATAKKLPNGAFGGIIVALKDNELRIYDAVGLKWEAGDLIYALPLRSIEQFQRVKGMIGEFFKGYSFRFVCKGDRFVFANCSMQTKFLDALENAITQAK